MLKSLATLSAGTVVGVKVAEAGDGKAPAAKPKDKPVIIDDPRENYPNTRPVEDMYRAEFSASFGDPDDHGTAFHCVNCQGNCAWQVWVKDGKITRENQSAAYPSIREDIPDCNPRGCNKGVQHSQVMYDADRLTHPMKRVGERGAGKWKRISWDEAIDEVATNLYRTMLDVGPQGNYVHVGAGLISEARGASIKRLGALLGAVRPYIASYVGDMFPGVSLVYGEGNIGCTFDFMYGTDVQVYWGCNPNTSRIPDAHYVWEGKYNGSKVIVISPEFNSTAIHADRWIPIKPGYDGHLAMSLMHEMVKEKLFDEKLVSKFTDLPMLIRKDTGELLRLSDIDASGKVPTAGAKDGVLAFDAKLHKAFAKKAHGKKDHPHDVFLAVNKADKAGAKLTAMPGGEGSALSTLRLRDIGWHIDPALSGTWKVALKDGKVIEVSTVFDALKAELADFTPEKTHKLTGVHPTLVRELARDIALPEVVSVTMGFALGKHFNGMLTQRAISSLMALTCRMGDRGGLNTENEWSISGLAGLSGFSGAYKHRFASGSISEYQLGDGARTSKKAYTDEELKEATGADAAAYRKDIDKLLAGSKNDAGVGHGKPWWDTLRSFVIFADARFRRNKSGYKNAFLDKAKFFAVADIRMSETAKYADIVLPCASHYEVWDLRTNPGYHRFANIAQPPKGLKPIGECKSEWHIATMIVQRMQALALAEFKKTKKKSALHIPDVTHTKDGVRPMDKLVELYTDHGKLGTDKQAVEFALGHVDQFRGEDLGTTYKRGGFLQVNAKGGKTSPLYPDKPYSTFENHYALSERFETLTGRLTFYVDHPIWLKSGAGVPTATLPLRSKRHPFLLMTPHARWSIHSTYKTSEILLRLQRGEPYVMVNPQTARKLGLKDGDRVAMSNDLAKVQAMAKVVPSVPEGTVFMEHGWEPFMYRGKVGHNALVGDMLNLLEVSDGWGHLKFGVNWDGNQHAYTGAVALAKV